ncbi:hypothetical protein JTB14_014643 [Gonioctena quinquepunctata]|nr:hypothetical protein JTB14_014643 [Gonioctena quinquepunctata]
MDDIICFSKRNVHDHVAKLRHIFERIRGAGLTLNPDKCELMKTETAYLGHIVSRNGVRPDPGKIPIVENYPVPQNVTDIRAFLGLVGYLGTEPTLEPIWNRERIRRSQQDDPAVRNIIGNILKNNSQNYYFDLDGVVYWKSEDSRHGDLLVATSALLPEIMKTYPDLPISGQGKSAKKWIGPYRIHGRVNARIEDIHDIKEQLVHINRLKRCLAKGRPETPIREEVQTISGAGFQVARGNKKAGDWGINESVSASTGEANRSGEKLTTGQSEIPPAEEPTSSGHPRKATATTEPPEDFGRPITGTQAITGTPGTATTGAEAVARMEGTTLPNLERTANSGEEPTRTPDSTRRHTRGHGPVPEHPWIRQSRI